MKKTGNLTNRKPNMKIRKPNIENRKPNIKDNYFKVLGHIDKVQRPALRPELLPQG